MPVSKVCLLFLKKRQQIKSKAENQSNGKYILIILYISMEKTYCQDELQRELSKWKIHLFIPPRADCPLWMDAVINELCVFGCKSRRAGQAFLHNTKVTLR